MDSVGRALWERRYVYGKRIGFAFPTKRTYLLWGTTFYRDWLEDG